MADEEVPADPAPAPRSDAELKRIQKLLNLEERLRKKISELEEREIGDDDAEEERCFELERKVSDALLNTIRKLAELGVGELDEEVLQALKGKRPPIVFKGSGHPILDERLSQELTKKQVSERTNFASMFLTPGHIARMIRVLREQEIKEKGKSSLPSKESNAWTELLIKIITVNKSQVTRTRYGHPQAMFESYLNDEEIAKLNSEKIEEAAAPLSLAIARQQFAADQSAEKLQLEEEEDSVEGSAEVESDDNDEEEEEDDEIDEKVEKIIRDAVMDNFLEDEGESGQQQQPPSRPLRKPAQPKKSNAQTRPTVRSSNEVKEDDDYASLLSDDGNNSDVVFFEENRDEVVLESEDGSQPQTSKVVKAEQMEVVDEIRSIINLSPEPPITPSLGEHNDLSPGLLENNENEQEQNREEDTESEPVEVEDLLKPSWLTGTTTTELVYNFIHCRPADEIEVIYETEGLEYETNLGEGTPNKDKMKRVRNWLETQVEPEIVDLNDEEVEESDVKNKKAQPAKRPHSEKTVFEPVEDDTVSQSPPKRPRTEEPVKSQEIEVIELD